MSFFVTFVNCYYQECNLVDMKTINLFAVALTAAALLACNGPVQTSMEDEVAKDVADWKPSESSLDSVCYYLGVNFASQLKGQFFEDMGEFDMEAFSKGMEEAFKAGQPKEQGDSLWAEAFSRNPWEIKSKIPEYFEKRRAYKAKYNERLGERYLDANKVKDSVEVAESGLQYILRNEGEGDKVGAKDTVVLRYKAELLSGTGFEAGDSTEFAANSLVKGLTEGLKMLGVGGKAVFYIPGNLAYGSKPPQGSMIAPNSTLIYEVEVLEIKPCD